MRKRIQEANTRHGRYRKAARESRRYIRELAPQRVQETAADLNAPQVARAIPGRAHAAGAAARLPRPLSPSRVIRLQ